jgi:hypothetical protein
MLLMRQAIEVPTLRSGDILTRREFHRRYEAMPGSKAELIDGVATLRRGLRTPEHAAFVRKLAGKRKRG